jgi:hypothetical protein
MWEGPGNFPSPPIREKVPSLVRLTDQTEQFLLIDPARSWEEFDAMARNSEEFIQANIATVGESDRTSDVIKGDANGHAKSTR